MRRLGFLGLAGALLLAAGSAAADCQPGRVSLRGDWGQASFSVEIADDEAERARGLMFRREMADGAGMLFVYDAPQPAAFWMKNTLIPLDILFADQRGIVTSIHENTVPGDLTPIDGGGAVFAVLEINAGLARRYGITAGSEIRHQVFSRKTAVWPC